MMGPLSDSRELAPHAMPGHKEGMGGHNDGTGQIAKGTCAVCQQTVYNSQERTKNKDGKCVRDIISQVEVAVHGGVDLSVRK